MTNLIFTISVGHEYQQLAELTHPTIHAYAKRIGADFYEIDKIETASTSAHWEKFQLAELLEIYDRVMYMDTDLIVRDDCPNLFDIVPENCLGMFNESPFTDRPKEMMINICKEYGVTLSSWNGAYYNSGVIVASQIHKSLFTKPEREIFNFYEQSYINLQIALHQVKMFELPYQYNRMSCLDAPTGMHRLDSKIVHYAGAPNTQVLLPLICKDLQIWKEKSPDYKFTRHIHVIVSGGLGDQVNAEPAIRYMREHIYPKPESWITVSTHFPELFSHLDVEIYRHGEFYPVPDTPYYTINSLPPPESVTWSVLSNLLCHTVDYCSAALLRRILPIEDKRVHLPDVEDNSRYALYGFLEVPDLDESVNDIVVVHAGRHWNTKTFPLDWWQEVVDGLLEENFRVCLVGQDEETRGVVWIKCPKNGIDLRNLLTLNELIGLLKVAPVLISNDSAPIHLAGAFDNGIMLIPSVKHPEHVLPIRYGNPYWNAVALYKRLTLDDVSSQPTEIHGTSAEFILSDEQWLEYLPDVYDVISAVMDLRIAALKGLYYASK